MIAVTVHEQSQVAEARGEAGALAERLGFSASDAGRVSLAATELATNLIKHGRGGELLIGTFDRGAQTGVELLALDKGPGMANIAACLEDGYSSAGTAGNGLGAIKRQAQFVEIQSSPGMGTAVLARLAKDNAAATEPASGWGAVSVPMPGEQVCGDAFSVANGAAEPTVLVADGLGHGPEAAEAAVQSVRLFQRFNGHQVPTILDYVHGGLRSTRGAAIAVARHDRAGRKVVFSGIGNIAGALFSNGTLRRMVSMSGTAGYNARKIQAFDYPFESGLLIMHSDGLSANWTLDRYRNVMASDPTLIAGMLYRDYSRGRDDATVLVAKW